MNEDTRSPNLVRIWRSMLFLPAHVEKFTSRAHERGADAVVLDLEDSVPLGAKAAARAGVHAIALRIASEGVDVLVRVNGNSDPADHAAREATSLDLDASVSAAVCALVLPKVSTPDAVARISEQLSIIEAARGIRVGHTRLIALIEDVRALPRLDEIAAASPRLLGMSLGPEDFSVSAGCRPTPAALALPSQLVLFACRRATLLPFGFPGSIAEFADLARLAEHVSLARELGFVGALCVHPAQVPILNSGFSPSGEELSEAREVLAACQAALETGRGAAELRGKMIDPPVVARAQEVLRRADALSNPT